MRPRSRVAEAASTHLHVNLSTRVSVDQPGIIVADAESELIDHRLNFDGRVSAQHVELPWREVAHCGRVEAAASQSRVDVEAEAFWALGVDGRVTEGQRWSSREATESRG